jgi:hypothetical protein
MHRCARIQSVNLMLANTDYIKKNDNSLRLIDSAISNNIVIGGTQFKHKNIHKGTWKTPDRKCVNQIDHILIEARH